jgi:hypothetical protein
MLICVNLILIVTFVLHNEISFHVNFVVVHLHALLKDRLLCRAPKFLVDPLEGPSMRQCGSGWNLGHDPDFQH